MNKKLLVSVFLFFFVFSSWMLPGEKTYIKEFLGLYFSPGYDYEFIPKDYRLEESFESGPLLTFDVPPSPKSKAIHFDIFTHVFFKWSDYIDRNVTFSSWINIISDVIPSGIEVWVSNYLDTVGEKNVGGNYDTSFRRSRKRVWRIMRRDSLDWNVQEGGEDVSEERELEILNNLIDNGFSVEIYQWGTAQGVLHYIFLTCQIEVTRITRK